MSLVNSPMQALVMLRIPRHLRPQALVSFGVFQCVGAPIGLILAGIALAHYDARAVLSVVLAFQTIAIAVIRDDGWQSALRSGQQPSAEFR